MYVVLCHAKPTAQHTDEKTPPLCVCGDTLTVYETFIRDEIYHFLCSFYYPSIPLNLSIRCISRTMSLTFILSNLNLRYP